MFFAKSGFLLSVSFRANGQLDDGIIAQGRYGFPLCDGRDRATLVA